MRPNFRFAPSPNGRLHLGHAYSALCNERAARRSGGRLRLRIEDTDPTRSKREFEQAIVADLGWMGVAFDGPLRRQSDHLPDYAAALDRLKARKLVYPCFCTRGRILADNGGARDPDGGPLHLKPCFDAESEARLARGESPGWRLDLRLALSELAAPLHWDEFGEGDEPHQVEATPQAWGDALLSAKDRAATYHLAVVVDDALQDISDVVRGRDLFAATSIHVLTQALLGAPTPRYHHHRLVLDDQNTKMSKSAGSRPLAALRDAGFSAADLRASLGFDGVSARSLAVNFS